MKALLLAGALLGVASLAGCGDDGLDGLIDDVLTQNQRRTQIICECWAETTEYDSEAECLTDNEAVLTESERQCVINAYGLDEDLSTRALECGVGLLVELNACLAAINECSDRVADSECIEAFFSAGQNCPEPSAQVQTAVDACDI